MTKLRTKNNKLNSISGLWRSLSFYIADTKEKIKIKPRTQLDGFVAPELNQKVIRVLRWYEKDGDALIGERLLNNINLSELQKLFGEPKDNLMFECYPINQLQATFLQRRLKQSFDFRSYAYFLECDAD